jgi:hypothetical protein
MGGASAQEGDGPIRLMVLIFGVAAAGAGTFVILLELLFEAVEIGDALGGSVDADPADGLGGGLLRWLLSGEAERRKKDGKDRRKNCELLFHEKTPFIEGRECGAPDTLFIIAPKAKGNEGRWVPITLEIWFVFFTPFRWHG